MQKTLDTFHQHITLRVNHIRLLRVTAQGSRYNGPWLSYFLIFAMFVPACLPTSYVAAAVALDQETNGGVKKFEVCDNIDLEMVLMEYESYHYVKFQKYPKLIRRTAEPGIGLLLKH